MVLWIIFVGWWSGFLQGVLRKVVRKTWFLDGENVVDAW